jgi:hypothetical protein
MRSLMTLLLLGVFTTSCAQDTGDQLLPYIREHMPSVFENEKKCNEIMAKCKDVKTDDPVLNGYIGGLHIARSRHAPLMEKVRSLKTGTTMLEAAIEKEPDHIELRFLRLTIQLNLPGFLGYNDKVESDKKFVLRHYDAAPPVLRSRIVNFVKTSGHFTESEQARVKE